MGAVLGSWQFWLPSASQRTLILTDLARHPIGLLPFWRQTAQNAPPLAVTRRNDTPRSFFGKSLEELINTGFR